MKFVADGIIEDSVGIHVGADDNRRFLLLFSFVEIGQIIHQLLFLKRKEKNPFSFDVLFFCSETA